MEYLLIVKTLFFWFIVVSAYSVDDESRLQTDLLTGYSTNVRPSDKVILLCSLDIRNVLALNIVDQTLAITGSLGLVWQDSRLSWNMSHYGNVSGVYYKPDQIWRPTLVLQNSVTGIEVIGDNGNQKSIPITVNDKGSVFWLAPAYFVSYCSVQVSKFPFDTQTCEIVISGWMLTKDIVNLVVRGDEITFRQYEENGEYEIFRSYTRVISVSMHHSEVEYLVFGLELKRKYSYYLVNIVLPVFFIQLLGIVVFAVPTDSGEKLTFSLTLLLSLTVMMTLIADKIPSTSLQIPMLSKYLLGGLVISSLELIVTVIILHFKHSKVKDVNMCRRMQAFANGLASITFNRKKGCRRQRKVHTTDSDIKPKLVSEEFVQEKVTDIDIKPTLVLEEFVQEKITDIDIKPTLVLEEFVQEKVTYIDEEEFEKDCHYTYEDISTMIEKLSLFIFTLITFLFTLTVSMMILY